MIKDKIKYGQLALLMCITLPAGKLLSLPYLCFRHTGKDFWLGMALAVAVELLALLAVAWGIKVNANNGNFSLKEVLQNTVGKFFTSFLMVLLAISFFIKFVYVLSDVMVLYTDIFVLKSDWTIFALIALLSIWFVLSRGFTTVARMGEILFIPIMVCLIAISVLSLGDCNFNKLLPIAEEGFDNIFESFLFVGFAFGDGALLAVFSGDVSSSSRNDKCGLVMLGAVVGALATIFVCVIYLALFGELAFLGDIAIARISQFNFNTSVTGRLDWLFISGWVVAVFLLLYLYAHVFMKAWKMATCKKSDDMQKKLKPSPFNEENFSVRKGYGLVVYICFAVAVIILPLFVDVKNTVLQVFMKGIGRYFDIAIRLLISFLYPFAVMISNRKTTRANRQKAELSATIVEA